MRFTVECLSCRRTLWLDTRKEAAEHWNTRPESSPGPSDEAVAALKDIASRWEDDTEHSRLHDPDACGAVVCVAKRVLSRIDSAPDTP